MNAVSRNRERYIAILRQNLPKPSKAFLSQGVLPAHSCRRQRLFDVQHELNLPQDWIASARRALQKACQDITSADTLGKTDYFLCALLHPTFISPRHPRAGELRRLIAMPAELTLCGASSLQLLHHALELHHRSVESDRFQGDGEEGPGVGTSRPLFNRTPSLRMNSLAISDLERLPVIAGLEPFLLFDPTAFPTREGRLGTPREVLLATTNALCGAIELTEGTLAVASFLEQTFKSKDDS
ncbi:unnamed protein product [Phytomonas sp. Hart1]|nr:unnamed protein product [Phytomonas sp. Hart1]|eukprot:CCW66431.1 unnamed protein product [Phytomonas sp. isolate Hart1]